MPESSTRWNLLDPERPGRILCGPMRTRMVNIFLAAAALAFAAPAQGADNGGKKEPDKPAAIEKKEPSSYYKPDRKSPAEQLAYADGLLGQNRRAKAGRQYLALVHTWHSSNEAPLALMKFAGMMEDEGDYERAFEEYEYVIRYYGGIVSHQDALDAEFRVANALLGNKKKFLVIFNDESGPDKALPMLKRIIEHGPHWERAAEAQLNIGKIHEQREDYNLAVEAYETVMQNYPDRAEAVEADFRIGNCLFAISEKRVRDERSAQRARTHLQRFIKAHPGSVHGGEVSRRLDALTGKLSRLAYERAVFYDRKTRKPDAAVLAYRDFLNKFPDSSMADSARQRIAELSARSPGGAGTESGENGEPGAGQ